MSLQLESFFPSLTPLRSVVSSPTLTFAMYLEWHLEKVGTPPESYIVNGLSCIRKYQLESINIKFEDSQKAHLTGKDKCHLTGGVLILPLQTFMVY